MKSNSKNAMLFGHLRRSVVISALMLAVLATLTIVFSSPLFAVLGFEYSTLMALALSFICGIAAINRHGIQGAVESNLVSVILESFALAFIPLVLSVISLSILPNCSFWDGLVLYFEIAFPSAILGGLFGFGSRMLFRNRRIAVLSFIGFWFITLFLSILPGYTNPQLFTYGWQYGFFPGFVWDESLELTNAYLAFRIENIIWVVFALSLAYEMSLPRRPKMWFVIPGVIALALFGFNDALHITSSHDAVSSRLKQEVRPVPNCMIYFAPGSLTNDELEKVERDVRWYLHDIRRRFSLTDTSQPIAIYIYPSNDAMFDAIGTRIASIAKPWLGEVHIAKGNLESLKHELTHVLLREKGVFPFYASWSTGITEGAAMSVEPEYDGIYTLDEHAAHILQLQYASGVKQIMSFTGFAASASEKSYVLAGSFSRYLLSVYGSGPFDSVYSSLDWQKEYGKPLDTLEEEWKRWLAPLMTPMDVGDTEHFRYYYDRSSIIYNPCLRRIGKLQQEAMLEFHRHHYADASRLFHDAIQEGAGISALYTAGNALIRVGNWRGAMALLDTTHTPIIDKQRVALDLQRADLHVMAGDTSLADSLYSHAELLKLNWQRFLLSYASNILLHSYPEARWKNYLDNVFTKNDWNSYSTDSLLRTMDSEYLHPLHSTFDQISFAIRIFRIDNCIRQGELVRAIMMGHLQTPTSNEELTENDSLALSIYWQQILKLDLQTLHENLESDCPVKYRRAAQENFDEINAEWKYLQSNPTPPGRETYP
jgi:hypothetical protein